MPALDAAKFPLLLTPTPLSELIKLICPAFIAPNAVASIAYVPLPLAPVFDDAPLL
jgi:hypothetical protein